LHRIVPTSWENSAIAHAILIQKIGGINGNQKIKLQYRLPPINLKHIKKLTTEMGIIQFSKINQPDITSGYTLDDNARALIALSMHFELTGEESDLNYINRYLDFIKYCQQADGYFLNYVDSDKSFASQNYSTNLADANGRAIWALGYLISKDRFLPKKLITIAEEIIQKAIPGIEKIHSTRAMAFAIKGLCHYNQIKNSDKITSLIKTLADRLVQMYRHESEPDWQWYESYLTYANSILPEALLCAWLETGESVYKEIAKASFDFLLSVTYSGSRIKVICNKNWLQKGQDHSIHQEKQHGEQPIDIAYTILALNRFYLVFKEVSYLNKMAAAFNWFLGNNHLHQIIYNPCTGGCYDGLEENNVNLNQGAESTLSYLLARLTIEQNFSST
jgi:hypothetical protein